MLNDLNTTILSHKEENRYCLSAYSGVRSSYGVRCLVLTKSTSRVVCGLKLLQPMVVCTV